VNIREGCRIITVREEPRAMTDGVYRVTTVRERSWIVTNREGCRIDLGREGFWIVT
jgi:hypothetical protein